MEVRELLFQLRHEAARVLFQAVTRAPILHLLVKQLVPEFHHGARKQPLLRRGLNTEGLWQLVKRSQLGQPKACLKEVP